MRCQYRGPVGANRDGVQRCFNEATRRTDSRALGRPDDALDLCQEHHEVVKAYWIEQAERLPDVPAKITADEPCEGC